MGLGIGLIGVCILCLLASLAFSVPGWVNIVGVVTGVAGLWLMGKGRKKGGGA